MKLVWSVGWLIAFGFSIHFLPAQPSARQKPKHEPDCSNNAFQTEATSTQMEGGCRSYSFKITTDGTSRYDLSHFTVAVPCGTIKNISNSRGWKQEMGKDPTTGLRGFKIDDISSFGKSPGDNFFVEFLICSDGMCAENPLVVAYKFGQCVKYDTLEYGDDGGGSDDDDDGDGDGDDGDDDGGDGDGGGDGDNCSTLLASVRQTPIQCFGQSTGTLEVVIESGSAPFSYRWMTGATGPQLQNANAGTYSVTVVDHDGNTLTLKSELFQPDPLVLTEAITHPSCQAGADGSISISVEGGSGPYSFSWNNGAKTQNLAGVNAGSYTLVVTDQAGCVVQKTFVLQNTVQITLSGIATRTNCGQATGSVDLTVSGGIAPYTFFWSNGATTEDIQNLRTGSYQVVVSDANGCQSIGHYFVQEVSDLRITSVVQKPNCANEPTGAIDVSVTGGIAPYTYSWQHGPTTQDVGNLIAGIYRVTVTDNVGCTSLATILVQKQTLQITAQVVQPLCAEDTAGSIILTPVGGTSPFGYTWSNGETDNMLTGVPTGTYTVTVTDGAGCSVTLSYTLASPAPISVLATVGNSMCGANGSYTINTIATGGRSPYQYLWSGGQTTSSVANLDAGTYQLSVRDVNGCVTNQEIVINPDAFQWTCLISEPAAMPVCHSVGNQLQSSILDASLYNWSLISSDNSWSIDSGNSSSSVIYSAGNPGTTATFTLTITKNGCVQTCNYSLSGSCLVRDNNGGGDPSNDDPCAESPNPTVPESVDPVIQVTAGKEQDESTVDGEDVRSTFVAFPNPFEHSLQFEWIADDDEYAQLEIYDQYGRLLEIAFSGPVPKGKKCTAEWIRPKGQDQLFFYRFKTRSNTINGKAFSSR